MLLEMRLRAETPLTALTTRSFATARRAAVDHLLASSVFKDSVAVQPKHHESVPYGRH